MKKHILAATDFSAPSLNAVKFAADMAIENKWDIVVLHVYPFPVAYSQLPLAVTEEDMKLGAQKEMGKLEKLFTGLEKVVNISTILKQGVFIELLEQYCEIKNPELVIMGTQGSTGSDVGFLGSHTVKAMQEIKHPVIAVPNKVVYHSFRNIGLASELKNVLETTPVEKIKQFAQLYNANLHVLNYTSDNEYHPELPAQFKKLIHKLEPVKGELSLLGADEADTGLLKFAEQKNIDLLIVIPHLRNWLSRIFHKSHTKTIVLQSKIPVMSIHV